MAVEPQPAGRAKLPSPPPLHLPEYLRDRPKSTPVPIGSWCKLCGSMIVGDHACTPLERTQHILSTIELRLSLAIRVAAEPSSGVAQFLRNAHTSRVDHLADIAPDLEPFIRSLEVALTSLAKEVSCDRKA